MSCPGPVPSMGCACPRLKSLAFDWPDSGEHFAVNAPLPPELAQVVEALEGAGA